MAAIIVPLGDSGGETWTADRRLCLTEDRGRVVPEDSPDARWLWAVPGRVVLLADAIRLGAVEPKSDAAAPITEAEPAEDEKPKPAAKRAAAKDS